MTASLEGEGFVSAGAVSVAGAFLGESFLSSWGDCRLPESPETFLLGELLTGLLLLGDLELSLACFLSPEYEREVSRFLSLGLTDLFLSLEWLLE